MLCRLRRHCRAPQRFRPVREDIDWDENRMRILGKGDKLRFVPMHPAWRERLLYAHRLLADPGYTVEDVALKLGYSKTKTLQMHLRAVFGLTAGELRVSLSTEEALATVTSRYFTPVRRAAAS